MKIIDDAYFSWLVAGAAFESILVSVSIFGCIRGDSHYMDWMSQKRREAV